MLGRKHPKSNIKKRFFDLPISPLISMKNTIDLGTEIPNRMHMTGYFNYQSSKACSISCVKTFNETFKNTINHKNK